MEGIISNLMRSHKWVVWVHFNGTLSLYFLGLMALDKIENPQYSITCSIKEDLLIAISFELYGFNPRNIDSNKTLKCTVNN